MHQSRVSECRCLGFGPWLYASYKKTIISRRIISRRAPFPSLGTIWASTHRLAIGYWSVLLTEKDNLSDSIQTPNLCPRHLISQVIPYNSLSGSRTTPATMEIDRSEYLYTAMVGPRRWSCTLGCREGSTSRHISACSSCS